MNRRPHSPTSRRASVRGVTIVELMVGIAIGMLIVAAMSILFANNSRSRQETERAGIKIDNGRYAINTLTHDIQHAGFMAEFDPRLLTLPAAKPTACETTIANLDAALAIPILGYDNVTASMLSSTALNCLTDVVAGTDIVVVRRAATCTNGSTDCTALVSGGPAIQASSCSDATELGSITVANYYRFAAFPSAGTFTLRTRNCTTVAPLRRYIVRIYYVAQNDKAGDGIPTLKRLEMSPAGVMLAANATTLVSGVENLQVEWGIDTNNDGAPDLFATDPDKYCATASTVVPAGTCWSLVVSSRLHVLARNLEISAGHTDTKTYVLGKAGNSTTGIIDATQYTVGPFNNNFKRSVFTSTTALQNVTARRFTP